MRFLVMVKYDENGAPPPKAFLDALAEFNRTAMKPGAMIERGGLQPSAMGSRLRLGGGKVSTMDGPFTETKEVIGGYSIFDVKSKHEVVEWISRFLGLGKLWPEWECEVEIRQILSEPHFGQDGID
jgi:hypothetical protein